MTDQVAPPRPAETLPSPFGPGWTSAAIAVHSVREIATPMLMQLNVADHGSIVIDFRHHAFAWDTAVTTFPAAPSSVSVYTQTVSESTPAPFPLPGYDLDPLLWFVGLNSFAGERASWLRADERYRLLRWPNLTGLRHSIDQMRMIALLSNSSLGPSELASAVQTSPAEAQRLINALSLMGILRVSAESPAPLTRPRAATAQEPSLFQRLRKRLGL